MKKFKLFSIAALCVAALSVFMVACQKDETIQTEIKSASSEIKEISLKDAYIKDGVFHFANYQSFQEAISSLNSLSTDSYLNYCDKNGIKTQQYHYMQLMKQFEHLSETENVVLEDLKQEYADILKFTTDCFEYKVQASHFVPIIDRNGLVYINDVLYRFDEFGQINVNDGDVEKLKKAINNRNQKIEGVSFLQNRVDNKADDRGSCGFTINTGWVTSETDDKRRGMLYAQQIAVQITYPNSSQKDLQFVSSFVGRAQKKVLGSWWDYSTVHTLNAVANSSFPWSTSTGIDGLPLVGSTSFNTTVVAHNRQTITYVHLLQYWSNVSQTTFDNATNFIKTFNSVNSNYSNQGGVNTNITCN